MTELDTRPDSCGRADWCYWQTNLKVGNKGACSLATLTSSVLNRIVKDRLSLPHSLTTSQNPSHSNFILTFAFLLPCPTQFQNTWLLSRLVPIVSLSIVSESHCHACPIPFWPLNLLLSDVRRTPVAAGPQQGRPGVPRVSLAGAENTQQPELISPPPSSFVSTPLPQTSVPFLRDC